MPPDKRLKRDIDKAFKNMKRYQRGAGQRVVWFRYNQTGSTSDELFDTGGQRAWFPPVSVPCISAQYVRASQNFDDDGLYLVDTLHMIISYQQFWTTGMSDPDQTGADHVNDRVAFEGRLFKVTSFVPMGQVAGVFLTISVDAVELAAEEMQEDVAEPAMFEPYVVAS